MNSNVFEQITLIYQEVNNNAYWYLKTIRKCINLAFYAQVVVEGIAVKVAKFRDVPL